MSREWPSMLRMATTVDGICGGAKWPALVFDSYQSARDWMVDVTPLEKLKPVLDVEDCVLFYFGRCTGQPATRPDEVFHLAIMPKSRANLEPFAQRTERDTMDPLLTMAFNEALQFADAPTKLCAMEMLVRFIIQDSTYSLPTDNGEGDTIDWNAIFEVLWDMLEADGWGLSTFGDKLLYSIPSMDFSNFEVGSTVFQSKRLALKKAVEYYASRSCSTAAALWDSMWIQMEERKQCSIMVIRNLTFFVTPQVEHFDHLKTGETMFASKKDAVIRFCRRIPDSSPIKYSKPMGIAPAPTGSVSHSATTSAKPLATARPPTNDIVDIKEAAVQIAPRKTLKRKMPAQSVFPPVVEQPAHRRTATSAYPWGFVWDVLSKDFLWKCKPGKFGFDFYSPDGLTFGTEEDVMEYLVTSNKLSEIERLIKLHGAPTPEQNKENSAKPLVNTAKAAVATKEPAKISKPTKLDSESDNDDEPIIKKTKALKSKKRLSYSSPKASNKPVKATSHRASIPESIGFGVIERVLKSVGWKWVQGKFDYVYCKPHVVLGNKGKIFSGDENVDFFRSKEQFELYVRNNSELMAFIRAKIRADKGLSPLKDNFAVLDMSSDEDQSEKERIVQKPKSKVQVVVDDESEEDLQKKWCRKAKKSWWLEENSQPVAGIPAFEVKFGNVYKFLQTKGWSHRPGQFGYDYYRPNVKTEADKILNKTYYQSEADMEKHLRTSGEWKKIEAKLMRQHEAAQAGLSSPSSQSSSGSEPSSLANERVDDVASPPPPGLFCRMWRRLEEKGWTKVAPQEMDGMYMYCCPNGKRYTKEELQMHDVETLINDHKKNNVVEVHDSSDSDDMQNDEAQKDDDEVSVVEGESSEVAQTPYNEDFTPSPSTAAAASKPAQTEVSPSKKKTVMQLEFERVLHNLSSGYTTKSPLLHRTNEWRELVNFFDRCITTGQRKSVFVSGAPGSGKSALMKLMEQHVVLAWKESSCDTSLQVVNLNAMQLGNAGSVYKSIAAQVTNQDYSTAEEATAALELAFKSQNSTTFLILDEIDVLLQGKGERDLYRLFEWAHHPFSSVIFVGIANSIDLTERHLPLLKSQDCKPLSVVFGAYSHDAISDILKQRVLTDSLTPMPVIDVMTLTFLARKVASTDGDIRKALSICRSCLMQQQMRDVLTPVTMADMVAVMKLYLTSSNASKWQQQPRLTKVQTDRPGVYNTNTVYDKYCEVGRKSMSMSQLISMGEFNQMLDALAAEGLVEIKKDKSSFKLFGSTESAEKYFAADPYFRALL
ncbi:hypothetical protein DYB32_004312 [Aphanomyces invadans]|uniref:AAA+ ATPase domain-containing protein n=1 Tax=Aphanomyces invadans TaxID=157072 RepID=A0A418AXX0_9STRA|nr:hypothetical protein DYB32_004312 [Aphanomyces invadans]